MPVGFRFARVHADVVVTCQNSTKNDVGLWKFLWEWDSGVAAAFGPQDSCNRVLWFYCAHLDARCFLWQALLVSHQKSCCPSDLFSRVLFSFLPSLLVTPLPPFSRHIFALFSPSKSALLCCAKGTAQSLERGSSGIGLSAKFGKEIALKKGQSSSVPTIQAFAERESAEDDKTPCFGKEDCQLSRDGKGIANKVTRPRAFCLQKVSLSQTKSSTVKTFFPATEHRAREGFQKGL